MPRVARLNNRRVHHCRHKNIDHDAGLSSGERLVRNTDNFVYLVANSKAPSDDIRVLMKPGSPICMRQNGESMGPGLQIVAFTKQSSRCGLNAEQIEH